MNFESNNRRRFIKMSLAMPMLANFPWNIANANAIPDNRLLVPQAIQDELYRLYGEPANTIVTTDRIKLNVPAIAENGAVVPITVSGEKGLVASLAVFVAQNPQPHVSMCTLYEGADLAVSLRIKVGKTSDVYLVAQTREGLVGVSQQVKVTIGCGGG